MSLSISSSQTVNSGVGNSVASSSAEGNVAGGGLSSVSNSGSNAGPATTPMPRSSEKARPSASKTTQVAAESPSASSSKSQTSEDPAAQAGPEVKPLNQKGQVFPEEGPKQRHRPSKNRRAEDPKPDNSDGTRKGRKASSAGSRRKDARTQAQRSTGAANAQLSADQLPVGASDAGSKKHEDLKAASVTATSDSDPQQEVLDGILLRRFKKEEIFRDSLTHDVIRDPTRPTLSWTWREGSSRWVLAILLFVVLTAPAIIRSLINSGLTLSSSLAKQIEDAYRITLTQFAAAQGPQIKCHFGQKLTDGSLCPESVTTAYPEFWWIVLLPAFAPLLVITVLLTTRFCVKMVKLFALVRPLRSLRSLLPSVDQIWAFLGMMMRAVSSMFSAKSISEPPVQEAIPVNSSSPISHPLNLEEEDSEHSDPSIFTSIFKTTWGLLCTWCVEILALFWFLSFLQSLYYLYIFIAGYFFPIQIEPLTFMEQLSVYGKLVLFISLKLGEWGVAQAPVLIQAVLDLEALLISASKIAYAMGCLYLAYLISPLATRCLRISRITAIRMQQTIDLRNISERVRECASEPWWGECQVTYGSRLYVLLSLFLPLSHTFSVPWAIVFECLGPRFDILDLGLADCYKRLQQLGRLSPTYNIATDLACDWQRETLLLAWLIVRARRFVDANKSNSLGVVPGQ